VALNFILSVLTMLVFLLVGGAVQQLWMVEEWPASGKVELDLPLLIGAPPAAATPVVPRQQPQQPLWLQQPELSPALAPAFGSKYAHCVVAGTARLRVAASAHRADVCSDGWAPLHQQDTKTCLPLVKHQASADALMPFCTCCGCPPLQTQPFARVPP
jgi:hypothetical protein